MVCTKGTSYGHDPGINVVSLVGTVGPMGVRRRIGILCAVVAVLLTACASNVSESSTSSSEDSQEVATLPPPFTTWDPLVDGMFNNCGPEPLTAYEDALELRRANLTRLLDQVSIDERAEFQVRVSFTEPTPWAIVQSASTESMKFSDAAIRLDVSPAKYFNTRTQASGEGAVRDQLTDLLTGYAATQAKRAENQRRISQNRQADGADNRATGSESKALTHEANNAEATAALMRLEDGSLELLSIGATGHASEIIDYLERFPADAIYDSVIVNAGRNDSLLLRNLEQVFTSPEQVSQAFSGRPMLPVNAQVTLWGGIACGNRGPEALPLTPGQPSEEN